MPSRHLPIDLFCSAAIGVRERQQIVALCTDAVIETPQLQDTLDPETETSKQMHRDRYAELILLRMSQGRYTNRIYVAGFKCHFFWIGQWELLARRLLRLVSGLRAGILKAEVRTAKPGYRVIQPRISSLISLKAALSAVCEHYSSYALVESPLPSRPIRCTNKNLSQ
jgi:hypothetical protein